ncbi:MAG: helix-hairpin-helix domain-containing protein [Bacteroidia bacterium]
MKQFFRDYFIFNKRERNGIFVLLVIILLLLMYLTFSDKFITSPETDFTDFKKEIEILEASANIEAGTKSKDSTSFRKPNPLNKYTIAEENTAISYFKFNPNQLPTTEWQKLGLTSKQINCIKKYEAKGGEFLKKEDLKKIYIISEKMYKTLEPYIFIPKKNEAVTIKNKTVINKIDLNSADSIQLLSIKGIGAFYAKAIIRYRKQLGGFTSKKQLLELWKFDNDKLQALETYITIDTSKIKKININTCSTIELKHPYLKWNVVNAIINYRLQHGNYIAISEIRNTDLVDEETFYKIAPYLIVK